MPLVPSDNDLPVRKILAGALCRRLPLNIRRIRMWRDRLYVVLGGGGWDEDDAVDCNWPTEPQIVRGRLSGMKMALDLTDWMQRRSYFTGRFYQEELEDLLTAIVRRGDNFVDVGANIGLVSLHAASLIGDAGKLWAFEPNPPVFARLIQHLEMNALDASRAFNMGLGSQKDELTLNLFGRHSGKASLLDHGSTVAKTVAVDIVRGDAALRNLGVTQPTVFKIDVEGFETSVLQGLGNLLDGNVAVVIEISKSWLKAAGSSAEELCKLLHACGLSPFVFGLAEKRMGRELFVKPVHGVLEEDQYDCLFMRPASCFAQRLGQALLPSDAHSAA